MNGEVIQVDAFTREPGKGNPAGVVLNGDDFTDVQMQAIAKKVGFNECVFVCHSEKADIRLRYFTPGHETPLCGHATVGAIFLLSYQKEADQQWLVETEAGILTVSYRSAGQQITMQQSDARLLPFTGSREQLCRVIGIQTDDLYEGMPIQYGNTGSWTLIVPVKSEAVLDRMMPETQEFPEALPDRPSSSIHPFAFLNASKDVYTARHFSSPYSGTVEDSVTGTASGVMGAYLMTHYYLEERSKEITVLQGKHVGREGLLTVKTLRAADGHHHVTITGSASLNKSLSIEID